MPAVPDLCAGGERACTGPGHVNATTDDGGDRTNDDGCKNTGGQRRLPLDLHIAIEQTQLRMIEILQCAECAECAICWDVIGGIAGSRARMPRKVLNVDISVATIQCSQMRSMPSSVLQYDRCRRGGGGTCARTGSLV